MNAQQLKNAILQEAIEGRLVPQDPNDEPASVLLDKIRKEKAKLVKEGKLKKKDLEETPISEDEKPFEIPESWEWVRWGALGEYKKGPFGSSLTKSMFVPKSDKAIKVYEQKNAIQKDYSLGEYYISEQKYGEMKGFTIHPGDIIVSCAGTIGETYLLPKEAPLGIINQALMRAKIHLDSIIPYWLLYFRYILVIENKLKGAGSAIKNIPPFEVLKAMPVALPPLAEQKRIVAKIEELLPKVEEYGKAQDALNKLNEELPERLKKSILQEAITGRLVPQDPNDEPASVLLDKIRAEKEQLVKEGKLKKKDLEETPISEDEIPFEIPESWEWCRLEDVVEFINGRAYKKDELLDKGKYKVLRVGNFFTNDSWYYSDLELPDDKYCYRGDLLYAWSASFGPKIWDGEKTIFHYHIWNVKYSNTVLWREYLYYFFLADKLKIKQATTGSTMIHVSMENMKPRLIPLPPLAEQHRIVEKIEQLLGEIDKLKF
jgi:type I restriction enzyme S subunit